ncbi:MAG: hypothetical protein U1D00_04050, partial [Mycobacterium sp.]|nr:hypothetical protein [Mycobacterium sp.]
YITSTYKADQAAKLLAQTPAVELRLMVDGTIDGYDSYEEALAAQPTTPLTGRLAGADMLYSSGTTGRPKGVLPTFAPTPLEARGMGVRGLLLLLFGMTDDGVFTLEASLPAVVSVNEKINEPRFPSFKGIMAAKKKEVTTLTLAEIGVEADEVGVANAGSKVLTSTPKPPKTAGEKVTDEGDGGTKIAEYLVAQKII